MITYVLRHDCVDLSTIVQESHTTLPIYPHFSYVLNPMPLLKGVQIQEGSLWSGFYALRASLWGLLMALIFIRGVWASFIDAVPSLPFNCFFSLEVFIGRQLGMKCSGLLQWYQQFSSAWASFTALTKCTINSSITPLNLAGSSLSWSSSLPVSSSKCTKHTAGFCRMIRLPFSFLRGEETSGPCLGRIISHLCSGASGLLYSVFFFGLSGSP